ncbi:hypothetical protein FPZ12_029150 [Amycolatopsis acidicola]|uniref:Uncharacterized protein n=1 Tax=Amycolatopsis acidicola TaxID=2596893 RepID=A0A5N0UVP1_9PSEU|nr:hypothetical protein [Amycolatopsis acidicola]KAA9155803.1 hypothetical protein FPZ12_029150 [Amycolatopsis acidicola]
MAANELNGNPTAQSYASANIHTPAQPASLTSRLGSGLTSAGMYEGMMYGALDTFATGEVSAFMNYVDQKSGSLSDVAKVAGATYSAADATSAFDLLTAGFKLADQVIGLGKKAVTSLQSSDSSSSSTDSTSGSTTDSSGSTNSSGTTTQSDTTTAQTEA